MDLLILLAVIGAGIWAYWKFGPKRNDGDDSYGF